jgi:hypothetical protein
MIWNARRARLTMNPAWRASAAWYAQFLDHMALPPPHCARRYLPRSVPIQREQFARMSPRVLAFYRATRTANDAFLLTPSHA